MSEKSVFYGLTPVQLMMAFAGGLTMFLASKEGIRYISESLGAAYVVLVAIITCAVLIAIFRSYEIIGASISISVSLFLIEYIIYCINTGSYAIKAGMPIMFDISSHTAIYWAILWAIPTMICIIIRMISMKFIDESELLEDFKVFFRSITISFYVFYITMILGTVVFTAPIGSIVNFNFNFIPFFNAPMAYFNAQTGTLLKFAVNCLILAPVGYTMTIYCKKISSVEKLLIYLIISICLQTLVCVFSTGMFDLTFIIVNVLGTYIGVAAKYLIDKIQYLLSGKQVNSLRCV